MGLGVWGWGLVNSNSVPSAQLHAGFGKKTRFPVTGSRVSEPGMGIGNLFSQPPAPKAQPLPISLKAQSVQDRATSLQPAAGVRKRPFFALSFPRTRESRIDFLFPVPDQVEDKLSRGQAWVPDPGRGRPKDGA